MEVSCSCGYTPRDLSMKDGVDRYKCDSNMGLQNHVVFLSFRDLPEEGEEEKRFFSEKERPTRFWMFVGEIEEVMGENKVRVRSRFMEKCTVLVPMGFDLESLQPSSMLFILYPVRSKDDIVLNIDDDPRYFHVFSLPERILQVEADNFMRGMMEEKKRCFQCGHETTKRCKACKIALYCSPECQRNNWGPVHRKLCKEQANILLRTLFLPYYSGEIEHPRQFDNLPEVETDQIMSAKAKKMVSRA